MRIEAISRPRSAPTRSICPFCDPIIARVFRHPCRCRGRQCGVVVTTVVTGVALIVVPSVVVPSVVMPLAAAGLRRIVARLGILAVLPTLALSLPSRRRDRPEGLAATTGGWTAGTATAPPSFLPGGFGRSFLPPSLGFFESFDSRPPLSCPTARQPSLFFAACLPARDGDGCRLARSAHWQASQRPAAPMYYARASAEPAGVGWLRRDRGGESAAQAPTGGVSGAGSFGDGGGFAVELGGDGL